MFTGIIQGKGKLIASNPLGRGMVFVLRADFDLTDPEEGESIAVNGVCLTARQISGRQFSVDVSPESLSRTILGSLKRGQEVNLERALRLSDRLGGHLVSGHVDGVSMIREKYQDGDFIRFVFSIPQGAGKYIIEKGSITINGISLTVNSCDDNFFSVAVIPHTLLITTLGSSGPGDRVNIEVDMIGKYVEKLLAAGSQSSVKPTVNAAFLAEHGFLK